MTVRLRFVTCDDPLSALIRDQAGECMPFVPSHVEAVVPEGYLGAHDDGGIQIRPINYDKPMLLAGKPCELFIDVPADPGQGAAFDKFIRGKIGAPYDWESILDFLALPITLNLHSKSHLICSAFMTLALRNCGALPFPLVVPAHRVSPRDLLLIISGRLAIPT